MEYRLVISTCPDGPTAESIARALIGERLAACVNILPGVSSIYEWNGEVVRETEQLLLIKTLAETYPRVEEAIRTRHPYELPEIIAVPIDQGLAGYLDWVNQQVEKKQ